MESWSKEMFYKTLKFCDIYLLNNIQNEVVSQILAGILFP